jgi:hypothetical protein
MKLKKTAIAFVLVITSACIHRNPEAAIRAALLDGSRNGRPSVGSNGERCSEPQVGAVQIMGNEATAELFQDCTSGSSVQRFSTDYLVVKQGRRWVVAKPLAGGVTQLR